MTRSVPLSAAALLAGLLALGACKPGKGGDAQSAPPADLDTTNASAVDGMSDAQLKEQAKAVSPEQARAMGIPDSAALPGSNEVSDSTTSPAARPDSAGATVARDSAAAAPSPAAPARPAARRDRP
jgi:hypothetical protein